MSLFRNRNKLEHNLREQLSDLEYRPSDTLWTRLEEQLPGEFEIGMQSQVSQFETPPGTRLWDKLEFELPEERKPASGHRYLAIVAIFLFSSLMAILYVNKRTVNPPLVAENNTERSGEQPVQGIPPAGRTEAYPAIEEEIPKEHTAETTRQQKPGKEAKKHTAPYSPPGEVSKAATPANVPVNDKTSTAQKTTAEQQPVSNQPPVPPATQDTPPDAEPYKNQPAATIALVPPAATVATPDQDSVATKTGIHEEPSAMKQVVSVESSPAALYTTNESENDEALTRFSITVQVGVHSSMRMLKEPTAGTLNFAENIALRDAVEMPQADWSGLFMADYALSDRMRISTGIGMLNFSQQFYYNTTEPTDPHTNEIPATLINPSDSIVTGSGYNTRIRYSWTEIPLFLTYRFLSKNKWHIELQSGVSWGILSTVDAGLINYNNVGILVCQDKTAFPGFKNSFFLTFNPGVSYQFNPQVSIALMPGIKMSLNSMTENEIWAKQYPYFVGVSAALRRRF